MTVLLTGGSRGVGERIARLLPGPCESVFFTYVAQRERADRIARELGERVACGRFDLADADALPALVDECVRRFGGVDALVNNAAVFEENPFDGDDYARWRAGWERTFAINLFGTANLTWLAMRTMRKQPAGPDGHRGRIINIASRAAHRGVLSYPA